MAVLTCAPRRPCFESSFSIVDVAGDDDFGDFGDRVEAALPVAMKPISLIGVAIGAQKRRRCSRL
jgi:hypothetical protein